MMGYYLALISFMTFQVHMVMSCQNGSEFCRDGKSADGNMKYAYINKATFNDTRIYTTPLSALVIQTMDDCMMLCIKTVLCKVVSFNPHIFKFDFFTCYLYSISIYDSKKLKTEKDWITAGAKSRACEMKPCLNGGVCEPVFSDTQPSTYLCHCGKYSSGTNCEHYNGTKQIDFDFHITKKTFGTSVMNMTLKEGIIVGIPERTGFVLFCNGKRPCVENAFNGSSDQLDCLFNPEGENSDCMISFWIRFRDGERGRFPANHIWGSYIFFNEVGLKLMYDHNNNQWKFHHRTSEKRLRVITFGGGDINYWHHIVLSLSNNPAAYLDGKAILESKEYGTSPLLRKEIDMFTSKNMGKMHIDPRMYISNFRLYPRFIDREPGFVRDLYLKEKLLRDQYSSR